MVFNVSKITLEQIADFIREVTNDNEYQTSKYEMFLDIMLSFGDSEIIDSKDSISYFRDAIGQLNAKLLAKYDKACELFDTANSIECFQPKYAICKAPSFCDYAELYISILAMEYLLVQNGSLDAKYSVQSIKRGFIAVLGRFLFLFNGYINKEYTDEQTNYTDVFQQIFSHTIRIASSLSWIHEEYPQMRVLLLNLYDAMSIPDKAEIKTLIDNSVSEARACHMQVFDDTLSIVYNSLNKYYEYLSNENNITEIKLSWLFAYIYKKRFGFMFCKKFAKTASTSSLPYKFQAYSSAFKNGAFLQVSNGPKVVLFDAGDNKRSSEYVPTQSSAFYNVASGMFE